MRSDREAVLRRHAAKYPLMEPTDAVKLLYQSHFGGGHLIPDPAVSLARLLSECETIPYDPSSEPEESIGGGIVRIMLAAVPRDADTLARLNDRFVRSAAAVHGTREEFLESLALLRRLTAEGVFRFSPEALDAYLTEYAAAGYPPVSHSAAYREAYHPAYRVVLEDMR